MIAPQHSRFKSIAAKGVAGGLALLLGGAATGHALGQGPHQICVKQQTKLLLDSTYELVPERAETAAGILCSRNNDKPGHKRFD